MPKSKVFIISGPSGAGEDSIIRGLKEYFPIENAITTTTRGMRQGESQGNPYYFVSQDEFDQKIKNDEFAEYAQQYNGNFYGVTKKELERVKKSGKIGIWKIEYKGVMSVKNKYPETIAILINAPSIEILENRIRKRDNVPEEYIKERTGYTQEWLRHADIYDYAVINEEEKLEEAVRKVAEIIKKHS